MGKDYSELVSRKVCSLGNNREKKQRKWGVKTLKTRNNTSKRKIVTEQNSEERKQKVSVRGKRK